MIKIYADLVELGLRTIEEIEGVVKVPLQYIEQVKEELKRRN